eukprot:m.399982 g.399982  ORF g.399982 m.399982 type:complete len:354 (+) comp56439_c0_seq1:1929-2990(+)
MHFSLGRVLVLVSLLTTVRTEHEEAPTTSNPDLVAIIREKALIKLHKQRLQASEDQFLTKRNAERSSLLLEVQEIVARHAGSWNVSEKRAPGHLALSLSQPTSATTQIPAELLLNAHRIADNVRKRKRKVKKMITSITDELELPDPKQIPILEEKLWQEVHAGQCEHDWTKQVHEQLGDWSISGFTKQELHYYCNRRHVVFVQIFGDRVRVRSTETGAMNANRLISSLWLLKLAASRAASRGNPLPRLEFAFNLGDTAQGHAEISRQWRFAAPLFCNVKCQGRLTRPRASLLPTVERSVLLVRLFHRFVGVVSDDDARPVWQWWFRRDVPGRVQAQARLTDADGDICMEQKGW